MPKSYLQQLQSLCSSSDDDGKIAISTARSIVLYKSSGLCPADLFVDKKNGALLILNQLCSTKTFKVVKQTDWNIFGKNLEKFIDVAVEKETKARSNASSLKCVVKDPLKTKILKLMEASSGNCKDFRASLFQMKKLKLCGIHFFRWDGTPRQSVNEINWAICHYPSSSVGMMNVLKVLLKGIAFVALVKMLDGIGPKYETYGRSPVRVPPPPIRRTLSQDRMHHWLMDEEPIAPRDRQKLKLD
jgi:hypothetical protein